MVSCGKTSLCSIVHPLNALLPKDVAINTLSGEKTLNKEQPINASSFMFVTRGIASKLSPVQLANARVPMYIANGNITDKPPTNCSVRQGSTRPTSP